MSAITTPFFIIFFIEDPSTIPRLIVINLSVIIYFELITFIVTHYVEKTMHYFAATCFDFALFIPVAIATFLVVIVSGIIDP